MPTRPDQVAVAVNSGSRRPTHPGNSGNSGDRDFWGEFWGILGTWGILWGIPGTRCNCAMVVTLRV
jgi:hypothetical protein